jgi:hypothetical protein
MSTVAEINEVIPNLTDQELQAVEQRLIQEYRKRNFGIIYDDDYGTWTEEDLRAAQEQVLRTIEGESPEP